MATQKFIDWDSIEPLQDLARAARRISQIQLTVQTGTIQSNIFLIERGFLTPDKEEKRRIGKTLGFWVDVIDWPGKGVS